MLSKIIRGHKCKLVEIEEKYFVDVINWRNTPSINKYLNQSFKLTLELQRKWYENYLKDGTQILYIILDENDNPVGTTGYTNIDYINRCAVGGRLIIDDKYRGTEITLYYTVALAKEAYKYFDYIYCHIVSDNVKAIRLNIKNGSILNVNPRYKELCTNSSYTMNEYISSKEDFYDSENYKLYTKLKRIEEKNKH